MTSFQIQTMTHSNFDLKIPWFTVSRISKLPSNDFLRKLRFNRIFFFLKNIIIKSYHNQKLFQLCSVSLTITLITSHTHSQTQKLSALHGSQQLRATANTILGLFNLWRNIYMASFKKLLYYAALMKSTDLLNRPRLFLI